MSFSIVENKGSGPKSALGILPQSEKYASQKGSKTSFSRATFEPGASEGASAGSGGHPRAVALSWVLPGHGEAYHDCGSKGLRGCSNVAAHPGGVDGRPPRAEYVEVYRRCCMRAECPLCYEAWAAKEGERAAHRLRAFRVGRFSRPVHVLVSPPSEVWGLEYVKLRRKAYQMSRKAGLVGGCAVFHPFRLDPLRVSPHFHVVGYGWIGGTAEISRATGWVVRNLGVRKTLRGTLSYLLSHAGIRSRTHSLTWFGGLSYNKLKVSPLPREEHLCPMCGEELRPFLLAEGLDPPDRVGSFYLSDGRFSPF